MATPVQTAFASTQIRLASGLSFAEELMLTALRPAPPVSGRDKLIAKRKVRRGLVVLTLSELMSAGRMRRVGSPEVQPDERTRFGQVGGALPDGPLGELQRELEGAKTLEMWITEHQKQVRIITARALAARRLVTLDPKSRPTLTDVGLALGHDLREGYTEILRGKLAAPRAEALWLITCDHAHIPSKVFRDDDRQVVLHGGFDQVTPTWQSTSVATPHLESLFTAMGLVAPFVTAPTEQ